MRTVLATVAAGLLLAAVPAAGQQAGSSMYRLDQPEDPTTTSVFEGGKNVRKVTVKFTITREGQHADDVGRDFKIIIFEEGKEVARRDVPKATVSEDLSVILAVDIRGSMAEHGRMDQVRQASEVFFRELPLKADSGLILFDHEMRVMEPLGRDRRLLLEHIRKAQPLGGSAYVDATSKAIDMLGGVRGKEKAVVVMTDGVDMNSTSNLRDVIKKAKDNRVRVYTIGIGEPGRLEPVTSVMVLDKSGSMLAPADDQDTAPKIEALKEAASQFLRFVRETDPAIVRTTILSFSDDPDLPGPFTNNRAVLRNIIRGLEAKGETALFDSTYEAVAALEAYGPRGKKAVVALTDGVDNKSRRRVDEVIERAKEAKIPLYMLGFGRPGELDEGVMQRMAQETGGRYYHAKNQKSLMQIFENLSIQLHDDGIDEASLKELSHGTGGQYYPAKDVKQMQFILKNVAHVMMRKEYTETFPSRFPDDGLKHPVTLKLVRLNGEVVGGEGPGYEVVGQSEKTYQLHGLVLPEVNHFVYLGMLALLGVLLALPAGLRRLTRGGS